MTAVLTEEHEIRIESGTHDFDYREDFNWFLNMLSFLNMYEYCKRFQQLDKQCIFQAFCTRRYNSGVNKWRTRQLSCSLKRSQFDKSSNNNNNKNCMGITKWNMRLLQSGTAFRYYKVGQVFLQC